jgi:hypothetical protein
VSAGGIVQMAEALGSVPSTKKKKKKYYATQKTRCTESKDAQFPFMKKR